MMRVSKDCSESFKAEDWEIFLHPLLRERVDLLIERIEREKPDESCTVSYARELLQSIRFLMFEKIPKNPMSDEYRLGHSLGKEYTNFFRAKFHARYRLFFRYRTEPKKQIIYLWLNDESTLRKSGGRTDPYRVFKQMLNRGKPPHDFKKLLEESENPLTVGIL